MNKAMKKDMTMCCWCLTALLSFSFGCVTTKEAIKLQQQMDDIKANLGLMKTETAQKLRDEVKSIRESQADLLERVGRVEGRLSEIVGRIDEAEHQAKEAQKKAADIGPNLGKKIEDIETALSSLKGDVKTLSDALAQIKEKQKALAEEASRKSPEDYYKEAYSAYKAGKDDEARDLFGTYLSKYPKGKNTPAARYYRGEALYHLKSYAEAIAEYGEVIEKFPASDKAPGAYLKTGLAFLELGEKDKAKLFLTEVSSRFPKSEQARIARKKLKKM